MQSLPAQDWQAFIREQQRALLFNQGFNNFQIGGNNNGLIGSYAFSYIINPYGTAGFKYFDYGITNTETGESINPAYIHAAPWIGAIVHLRDSTVTEVSTAFNSVVVNNPNTSYVEWEFLGYTKEGDSVWRTSINDQNKPNRRYFDDDGDGVIDEDDLDGEDNDGDWLINRDDLNRNRTPDHGEPNVDEDYGAVSESDVTVAYTDSFSGARFPLLGVKVVQKSYAWDARVKECIFPFEYYFINKGPYNLDSVYLGVYFSALVSTFLNGANERFTIEHLSDIQSVVYKADRDNEAPYVGATLLGTKGPSGNLTVSMLSEPDNNEYSGFPLSDKEKYKLMASGTISQNVPPRGDVPATLISVGPFTRLHVGDTLKLAIAIVAGDLPDVGRNNFRDNAIKARGLYKNDWGAQNAPPALPIKVTYTNKSVTLDWTWHPGDKAPNPLETWDDSNKFVSALPDTHWRRKNPPTGHTSGGRIFEGFKLWRSEHPDFKESQFTLLKQFDIDDDLGFNSNTGLQWTYTDTEVVRGRRYWYAVTSFTIPDYIVSSYQSTGGGTISDTVLTEPIETGIHENAVSVPIPFAPATKPNEVKVVPNPYRTDKDYRYESAGWEGLGRVWDETKRAIWFIHLPPRATIRVFSLAGELISTIEHDDLARTANNQAVGQEEWELLSDSHRALASGIYIFTVESDFGKQIGKFVVIR